MKPTIAIINESSVITDAQLAPIVAAIQIQVSREFAPVWGADAEIRLHTQAHLSNQFDDRIIATSDLPPGCWWIVITDNSDEAGALGYHDTTPEGLPLGKVFAKSTRDAGESISVSLSHETLEMLADPDLSTLTIYQNASRSMFLSREVGDPCEADRFGYQINGITVSDFLYPDWFHDFAFKRKPRLNTANDGTIVLTDGDVQFDHAGHISAPFQFLEGGYISVFDPASGGWRDVINIALDGPLDPLARPRVGSRRERRRTPRSHWRKSKGSVVVDAEDGMRAIMGQ